MLRRISDPQVSPDGRTLAFVERETDMAANRGRNACGCSTWAAPRPRRSA